MNKSMWIFILSVGLSLQACDKGTDGGEASEAKPAARDKADAAAKKAEPEPEPEPVVDAATKAAAQKLAAERDGDRYPSESGEKANARVFLYLASTESDPEAIVAALDAMEQTWTSSDQDEERELADADYHRVVRRHLKSDNADVLKGALAAARISVRGDKADDATLDELQRILTSHEKIGARFLAVDTIGAANHDHPRLGALLLEGMAGDQHDVVVSKSVDRIPFITDKLSQRKEVMARVGQLLTHKDPGVRGNAAKALGDLATDAEHDEVRPKLEGVLADEHAFVRAAALSGLGRMRNPKAIEAIVGQLDDETKGTYALEGWKTLAGRAGRMHHQGGAWFRVDRMALQALQDCTWRMGDKAFKHDKIDFKTEDKDVAKAIKQAKAWYKKHRAALKTG